MELLWRIGQVNAVPAGRALPAEPERVAAMILPGNALAVVSVPLGLALGL